MRTEVCDLYMVAHMNFEYFSDVINCIKSVAEKASLFSYNMATPTEAWK